MQWIQDNGSDMHTFFSMWTTRINQSSGNFDLMITNVLDEKSGDHKIERDSECLQQITWITM